MQQNKKIMTYICGGSIKRKPSMVLLNIRLFELWGIQILVHKLKDRYLVGS